MRTLLVSMVVIGAVFGSYASQPGRPLDCEDWVILEPGITCAEVSPNCLDEGGTYIKCPALTTTGSPDNTGGYVTREVFVLGACGGVQTYRTRLVRWTGTEKTVIAYIDDRCVSALPPESVDAVAQGWNNPMTFSPTVGRVLISFMLTGSTYPTRYPQFSFGGFTTMFDVLQSFEPQTGFGFRVPYNPEGLAGADHFDTYVGEVMRPLDLSQAQPLQCAYPTSPPAVGEYEQITPPVPTPAPGHANYVLTAVTYQGQTRAGRQAIDGHLHGRDASVLPACMIEKKASNTKPGEVAR